MLVYQRVYKDNPTINAGFKNKRMIFHGYQSTKGGTNPLECMAMFCSHGKVIDILVPSGKLLHSYGKSPFLMGKLTINGHFQ